MAQTRAPQHMPSNTYVPDQRGLGRPVDRGQETYEPSPYSAQKVLPHGDVSRQGDRVWPRPSMTSRVLVYGGAALAAAAATAGAVLAVRKVADMVSGNDDLQRDADRAAEKARDRVYDSARDRSVAPRFAELSDRDRAMMRARTRTLIEADEHERERIRAGARQGSGLGGRTRSQPSRKRMMPKGAGFLEDVEHTAQTLTRNINTVVGSAAAAMAAFRSVSNQAEGLVHQFRETADNIRNFLGSDGPSDTGQRRRGPGTGTGPGLRMRGPELRPPPVGDHRHQPIPARDHPRRACEPAFEPAPSPGR